MPLQLTATEASALATLDAQLDIGMTGGAEFPPATTIVKKLEGYDKPMIVSQVDQSAKYKPMIRDSFRILIAALLKCAEAWQPASFQNSWVNYDTSSFTAAGYYKDFNGRCFLRGLVRSGTFPGTIFTLPVGYRPTKTHIFNAVSNDLFGQVRVQADGQVVATTGSNAWISLDQIDFRAEQ